MSSESVNNNLNSGMQGRPGNPGNNRGNQKKNTRNNTPRAIAGKQPPARIPGKPVKPPSRKKKRGGAKLKIIPLGGLEQIGMNITAFEYGESIVVVDCGLAFPEDDMLGIDLVIPDITYLKENRSKVKGFVIPWT